ncbi:hypothetical protein KL86DYS2_10008 [uncultured Dysgonomonas sp.]|uniref:Uncharacterized protein n=1 Tax=uncultured Dysgonomonas sp. TaxID=206096 RepID=A0A212ITE2_9BACT|nr:hypothetical protein KL86DYS2_10008 [uncultured Dysgonomonas sp.]
MNVFKSSIEVCNLLSQMEIGDCKSISNRIEIITIINKIKHVTRVYFRRRKGDYQLHS